jgi:hypothetical protein
LSIVASVVEMERFYHALLSLNLTVKIVNLASVVLVVLDLNTDSLSSGFAFLHSLSNSSSGSGVTLVVLCSINKSGG